jgi:hypothetical protein
MAVQMDELDSLIAEKEEEARNLRSSLARVEQQLKALRRARDCLRTKTDPAAGYSTKGRESIPTLVEQILREHGPQHVDDLVARLAELGVFVNKGTVTSSLVRYIRQEKRFRRVGRNKFALREGEDDAGRR